MFVYIGLAILIFGELIIYIIFADVILSRLTLMGIRFRPRFISLILDPLYSIVRKYIPTTVGVIDFTPIVVIIMIYLINGLLFLLIPGLKEIASSFIL